MDIQGHRGCRGLMPENTLEGFIKALDLGVNTLEMDVVITADHQVLVSHEAWFEHDFCLDSAGQEIPEATERSFNIYQMTFDQTQKFDCGSKAHPRFPKQKKMVVRKPLLRDVIRKSRDHATQKGMPTPRFNIELKREPAAEGTFQPELATFVQLVHEVLMTEDALNLTTLQAFEIETLKAIRTADKEVQLSLLVDEHESYLTKLSELGFSPSILSPYHGLVDQDMMRFCEERNLEVIPWTVNELEEMERLINLGVAGMISDYPDELVALVAEKKN